jgi:hypothetical protein
MGAPSNAVVHLELHTGDLARAAHYVWEEETESFAAHSINVLGLRGDRIMEITAYLDVEAFGRFGLAGAIQASAPEPPRLP